MRVAHLSATFPPYYAGSGNVCFHQAQALAARGHDVTVFTATYPGRPVDPAGVTVRRVRPILRLGNAPLIPRLAGLSGFDVIHLHQPFIFGAEAALVATARTRAPLVSSFHNQLVAEGVKGALFRGYDATITRAAVRRSAVLAVLSLEHARAVPTLAAELDRRPTAFRPVPNAVDTAAFAPRDGGPVRARLGIPDDAVVGVFCAKLDAAHLTKRPDLALAAVREIAGLRLLVVGGGTMLEHHRAQVAEMGIAGRVAFAGDQDPAGVAEHLAAGDFLMMPSTLEGFGIVQIEAMAAGKPVVVSRVPGAQGVSRDGVDAVHVEPGSLSALVAGVRRLLAMSADERRAMGAAGRRHVLAHYTWPRVAELLEDAYAETLSRRAARLGARAREARARR